MGGLYLVYLCNPSTIEAMKYDIAIPGLYLAQPEMVDDGKAWRLHHPGFRYRSTGEFSVRPRSSLVPSFAADYWIRLPNVNSIHATQ